jgi:hypothetical protein
MLLTYVGRVHYTFLLGPWYLLRGAPLLLIYWLRSSKAPVLPICFGVGTAQMIATVTIDPLVLGLLAFPRGAAVLAAVSSLVIVILIIIVATTSRHSAALTTDTVDVFLMHAGLSCLLYLMVCIAPLIVLTLVRLLLMIVGWRF